MSQMKLRTMVTGVAGEGADVAQWRAANEHNCGCTGKSTIDTPDRAPDPEQAERRKVLARLRNMSPAEMEALNESIRRDWLKGFEPPDSYAAALEELRGSYETAPTDDGGSPDPYAAAIEQRRNEYTEVDR